MDFQTALGSIHGEVFRKMIAPGKILHMVHVNTKFHDSS